MDFARPADVRRQFSERTSAIMKRHIPVPKPNDKRRHTNHWPGSRLDYAFLERCKEVICRAKHPTAYYKHKDVEYRVSIMPWSHGSYLDIRTYQNGYPKPTGILLHLDIASAILPDIIAAVRQMENMDTRDVGQKSKIQVLHE